MQVATAVDLGLVDRRSERKNGPRNLPEGRIGGCLYVLEARGIGGCFQKKYSLATAAVTPPILVCACNVEVG